MPDREPLVPRMPPEDQPDRAATRAAGSARVAARLRRLLPAALASRLNAILPASARARAARHAASRAESHKPAPGQTTTALPSDQPDSARARLVSPLMRRILLVNTLPLIVLGLTLLFLNEFRTSLLAGEVTALREQARIYGAALGQTAVTLHGRLHAETFSLEPSLVHPLLLRLTEPSPSAEARIFAPDGQLVADSRQEKLAHQKPGSPPLPPDEQDAPPEHRGFLEHLFSSLTGDADDGPLPDGSDSASAAHGATAGSPAETPPYIRRAANHVLVVTVAEPIIHDGQTVGIIQLTRTGEQIDRSLFEIRSSIVSLFLLAMAITVLLSWYLSQTIARPLLRLARSAHVMRLSTGRAGTVPSQLLGRGDEIGDVARALQDSAQALWARMDSTERFAADVAHEIKNPLTSIRSAIETMERIGDPERSRRLLSIIGDDVKRLDRLITDISDASRLDAEMSRVRAVPVAVTPLLSLLADIHLSTRKPDQPEMSVSIIGETPDQPLKVLAVEDRLVQVLRNLIGNAISFSPPGSHITLQATTSGPLVEISVSDEGPGIPPAKLDSIFDRFYSERPQSENFGEHSGLGLSISRQIVQALRGTISAENRHAPDGQVLGARFIVRLPRAP